MIASRLAYQLIDLLFAAAVIGAAGLVARRLPPRFLDALVRRWPAALATPFRRLALLGVPGFVLLMLVAAICCRYVVFHYVNEWLKGHPELQRAANVGLFLILGATYLGLFVLLPLLGLKRAFGAAAAAGVRGRRDRRLAIAACAASGLLLWYTLLYEPDRIVLEEQVVELPAEALAHSKSEATSELRIVLLADLQSARLGPRERRVPELVAGLRPDLVLVAGDLVAESFDESQALEQARHVLSSLSAPLGVFVVNGDVDGAVEGGIARVVQGTGARLLANESVLLACDPPVELAGFDPEDEEGAARLLLAPPKTRLRIALTHRPRHYRKLGAAGYPLVLAGHTHGGQVVVPGFGPPVTFETVPRAVAAGGLHRMENGVQLYVTRGIGLEGGFAPPIRFFCPPEITLLRVKGAASVAGRGR